MLTNTRLNGLLASCRIVILLSALFSPFSAFCDDMGSIQPTDPAQFPDIAYKDEKDQTHHLKQELGRLTIVHFWATWCQPCIEELPAINAIQKDYSARGLKVIDISEDGATKMPAVKTFFSNHAITSLTPYIDSSNESFKAAQGRGLPTSYFIDSQGMQFAILEGPIDWQAKDVKAFIEMHLKNDK